MRFLRSIFILFTPASQSTPCRCGALGGLKCHCKDVLVASCEIALAMDGDDSNFLISFISL